MARAPPGPAKITIRHPPLTHLMVIPKLCRLGIKRLARICRGFTTDQEVLVGDSRARAQIRTETELLDQAGTNGRIWVHNFKQENCVLLKYTCTIVLHIYHMYSKLILLLLLFKKSTFTFFPLKRSVFYCYMILNKDNNLWNIYQRNKSQTTTVGLFIETTRRIQLIIKAHRK